MAKSGTVRWYDSGKGYGFIKPDEAIPGIPAGKDLFVHASALEKSGISELVDKQDVEFEVGENKGRICAVSVKIV